MDVSEVEEIAKKIITLLWAPCLSCDRLLFQEFDYCPYCGKEIKDSRFTSPSMDVIVVRNRE